MDRINGLNTTVLPSGKRGWVNKNAAAGVAGTQIDAVSYMNPQQEELVGGLIEWAGLTPDFADTTQIQQALLAKFQQVLGFTPAQQGTGGGQLSNAVKIGYDGSGNVRITIDVTDFGPVAFQSWVRANFVGGSMKSGVASVAQSNATVQAATVVFASAFPTGCTFATAVPAQPANTPDGYRPTVRLVSSSAAGANFEFDTLTGVGATTAVDFNETFFFSWIAFGF